MKPSLRDKLDALSRRLEEIDALLGAADTDAQRLRELGSERAELAPVAQLYGELRDAERAGEQARELLGDPEMRGLAEEELDAARQRIANLHEALQRALLPRDPDDRRPAFVEVRAGTGGEESALFASELARMYTRYAERRGWRVEVLQHSDSELGGVKEAVLRISGEGVYGRLKFESGGHRVQRVPATEAQGRIHTSAATVAALVWMRPWDSVAGTRCTR